MLGDWGDDGGDSNSNSEPASSSSLSSSSKSKSESESGDEVWNNGDGFTDFGDKGILATVCGDLLVLPILARFMLSQHSSTSVRASCGVSTERNHENNSASTICSNALEEPGDLFLVLNTTAGNTRPTSHTNFIALDEVTRRNL
ncbi:hypothetical protein H4R34_003292 [Dimargaris verticillata]|uniref:Uncharacterized protein n=1 Tax=Dimargaris verticillata TaxID=2761393 RepID=A0A9W8ECS6_9FUNG|nr:hypothetical protein H4R34_003292 [Dimargaris verticillata]